MGTRKSKHNKGRKPLYKHFERDTVRGSAIFDEPAKPREKFVPPPDNRGTYTAPRTAKVIQLEEAVLRYMERRAASVPVPVPVPVDDTPEKGAVALRETFDVSRRDILMQLFRQRQISGKELMAGRAWQDALEWSTIQPTETIAWDPDAGRRYQEAGSVTEGQWQAMRRRSQFGNATSKKWVALADFCLGQEWQQADLMRALRLSHAQLVKLFGELMSRILTHFPA